MSVQHSRSIWAPAQQREPGGSGTWTIMLASVAAGLATGTLVVVAGKRWPLEVGLVAGLLCAAVATVFAWRTHPRSRWAVAGFSLVLSAVMAAAVLAQAGAPPIPVWARGPYLLACPLILMAVGWALSRKNIAPEPELPAVEEPEPHVIGLDSFRAVFDVARAVSVSLEPDTAIPETLPHVAGAVQATSVLLVLHAPGSEFPSESDRVYTLGWDAADPLVLNIALMDPEAMGGPFGRGWMRADIVSPAHQGGKKLGLLVAARQTTPFDATAKHLFQILANEIGAGLATTMAMRALSEQAELDPVSGLLNHRAAQELLRRYVDDPTSRIDQLALLVLDVDNFKQFNDMHGHVAGDEVLAGVSAIIKQSLPEGTHAARYGGDEFMVIMPHMDRCIGHAVRQSILSGVRSQGYVDVTTGRVIPCELSIGVAAFPEDAQTRTQLITAADARMYEHKRAKRGHLSVRYGYAHRMTDDRVFRMVEVIVDAVNNKDSYTRRHSEEVAVYSEWICGELGLPEEDLERIRLSALVHDVGKIGVRDDVLRKPGALGPADFAEMRQHPEIGSWIVQSMPGLERLVPGVRHHHERFDGRGYPDGLAGQDIPFDARVLAVADVYSALTTDRPYRRGLTNERAQEEILLNAGTQFDPIIVQAFLRAVPHHRLAA